MKKVLIILLVVSVAIVFSFAACSILGFMLFGDDTSYEDSDYAEDNDSDQAVANEYLNVEHVPHEDTGTDWVMYWYLCGSDLESYNGSATEDLFEMMETPLPEGVQVIIQTGGAYEWQNDFVDPNYTERYIYDSEGMRLIEQLPVANMGDPNTLADFLSFAETNYPGDRTMLNFWNHGGGSVYGAAFDELYDNDALTLDEMYAVLADVYGTEVEYAPLDIVGFDTCLMATLSTAYTFSDHASYLVASQELEPGNGWYYTGIMDALADNPTISPVELSVAICDTYVTGCEYWGTHEDITLSVTDLSKLNPLIEAYDAYGADMMSYALEDPSIFTRYAQNAQRVENYGGNSREQGFYNMVDLGQMVLSVSDLFPTTSQAVLDALDDAVVYTIDSIYRPDGMGLSTFYHYDNDVDHLMSFTEINPVTSLNHLYVYGLTGYVDDSGLQYIEEALDYTAEPPELPTIETVGGDWENAPLTINDDGNAVLNLGPEAYDALTSIAFELYYTPGDEDLLLSLGTDNDLDADWENGVFMDNFRGVWGYLDGALCYMELVAEGDNYNEYAIPIILNGEEYTLSVIYDFDIGEYIIMGARKPISEEGAADKNMVELVPGDVIETIHYATDIESDADFMQVTVDTITVTESTAFTEEWLPDGFYLFMFRMEDSQGNYVYSDVATFESLDGELFTYYE